jgi:hypothetical protein
MPGVELNIELSLSDEDLAKIAKKFEEALGRSGLGGNPLAPLADGADEAAEEARKLARGLGGVEDAAERAADAAEGLLERLSMEDAIGGFGDLKDVFEKTAGGLFGISEAAIEATVRIGDVVEKGANLGKLLGPEGAVAGALLGVVVGGLSEWAAAADRAREAQIALNIEALQETNQRLEKQEATIAANIKVWDDYTLAVRRANGTSLALVEGLVDAEAAQFKAEQDARKKRLAEYLKAANDTLLVIQGNNQEILSSEGVENAKRLQQDHDFFKSSRQAEIENNESLLEYQKGVYAVSQEIATADADRKAAAYEKLSDKIRSAFDDSTEGTKEFSEELDRIKNPPTIKDLIADQEEAGKAIKKAEDRIVELKAELTEPVKEGEGTEAYLTRIKGLLIDAAVASGTLAQAQADMLKATSAVEGASKPKGESDTYNTQIAPKIKINASKTREEAGKARVELDTFIEDFLGAPSTIVVPVELEPVIPKAEVDAQALQDQKDVEALNKEEAYQKNLIELYKQHKTKKRELAEKEADEEADRQAQQLERSAAFENALIDGALETAGVVADALAGQAVKAFNQYLDAVANGEKITKEQRQRNRAEFLRDTGSKLITDGSSHILMGVAKGFGGDPAGWAEAIAGGAEVALGGTMGGVGAKAQQRLGGTSGNEGARGMNGGGVDGGPRISNVDNAAQGPNQLAPVIIYLGGAPGSTTIHAGSGEEAKANAGAWVNEVAQAAKNAGPTIRKGG